MVVVHFVILSSIYAGGALIIAERNLVRIAPFGNYSPDCRNFSIIIAKIAN